jgi:hypothetical protein
MVNFLLSISAPMELPVIEMGYALCFTFSQIPLNYLVFQSFDMMKVFPERRRQH